MEKINCPFDLSDEVLLLLDSFTIVHLIFYAKYAVISDCTREFARALSLGGGSQVLRKDHVWGVSEEDAHS